jgi:hypothetical protein
MGSLNKGFNSAVHDHGTAGNPKLYASAEMKQQMGWIGDRLPGWAGQDVLVIGKKDLEKMDSSLPPGARLKQYLETYRDPDIRNAIPNKQLAEYEGAILRGEASATNIEGKNNRSFGIITAPDMSLSARQYAAQSAHLPPESLRNIPGTRTEWQAKTFMHEAEHLKHDHSNSPKLQLRKEMEAEQGLIRHYFNEKARGQSLDPAVLQSVMDMRAIGAFRFPVNMDDLRSPNTHPTHATASAFHNDRAPENAANSMKSLAAAQTKIHGVMGLQEGLEKFQNGLSYKFKIDKELPDALKDREKEFPKSVGFGNFANNPMNQIRVGEQIAKDNPGLQYAYTKALLNIGALNGNPEGKDAARHYVSAMEKHAPSVTNSPQVQQKYQTLVSTLPDLVRDPGPATQPVSWQTGNKPAGPQM